MPWEASINEPILNEARYEIARSVARERGEKLPPIGQMKPQQIIDYLQEKAAPVCDPFSGGGSIPMEAQRLGLRAIGSDLNPVAVLIGKALIEFPPKFSGRKPVNPEVNALHQWKGAQGIADDVRYYGTWMRDQVEKRIGPLFPKARLPNGNDATVIAWLWARTVPSPDPRAKGAFVPLASSFVLSPKAGNEAIVKPVVDHVARKWSFQVDVSPSKAEMEAAKNGTKAGRASFSCILTGSPIDGEYIDAEARAGRMSERLMAIVAEGQRTRIYLSPTEEHVRAIEAGRKLFADHGDEMDCPTQECRGTFASNAQGRHYKFRTFSDYFLPRQLIALTTLSDLVCEAREKVLADAQLVWSGSNVGDARRLSEGGLGPPAYADAVATYLAFLVSRAADRNSTLCSWDAGPIGTKSSTGGSARTASVRNTFARQAIQMTWDFAEANPLSASGGGIESSLKWIVPAIEQAPTVSLAEISCRDAAENSFPSPATFSTDPPYYDNIVYSDLSDYLYVWLRRTLRTIHPDLFRRVVTAKTEELVATPYRHGGKDNAEAFFLSGMKKALAGVAKSSAEVPATIFYAFKQSELSEEGITSAGWASFLQAITDSGLAVDGTWPVRSELSNRMIASGTNALASSIVLVCRKREASATTITRSDFLRALRREMPAAILEIRRAGVGPTDIQQSAIGPGIGIFTRHASVLNTDGSPMSVRDALKLINQVREEITSTGDADYDSETRFALDWFAAKGFEKGKSGDAILMTTAVDVSLDDMNAAGFFEARGGDARLLRRHELPNDWDPATDTRSTVWEACQNLVKRLTDEHGGIEAAAALYNRLGALAEPAHALARRLYDICEQKKWASEGRVYNQLHQEWSVIEKRAAELAETRSDLFNR